MWLLVERSMKVESLRRPDYVVEHFRYFGSGFRYYGDFLVVVIS